MTRLKVNRLKTHSGGEIEIRKGEEGRSACPVCGVVLEGEPAWYLSWPIDKDGKQIGDAFAVGSHNICPCCNTHYGYDDTEEGRETAFLWVELRAKWLERIPHTPELAQQLKNIGIEL